MTASSDLSAVLSVVLGVWPTSPRTLRQAPSLELWLQVTLTEHGPPMHSAGLGSVTRAVLGMVSASCGCAETKQRTGMRETSLVMTLAWLCASVASREDFFTVYFTSFGRQLQAFWFDAYGHF